MQEVLASLRAEALKSWFALRSHQTLMVRVITKEKPKALRVLRRKGATHIYAAILADKHTFVKHFLRTLVVTAVILEKFTHRVVFVNTANGVGK